jgi:hypothetical protein
MSNSREILGQLFGDYRAEWQRPYFASLFVPPPYLAKLETNRPCLLIGGRGTGKTTALKSLRFDASEIRLGAGETASEALSYFGIYIRVNKNRVRAFDAPEISEAVQRRAFAHYFNILVCEELCELSIWLEQQNPELKRCLTVTNVAETFGLEGVQDLSTLRHELERLLTRLELWVNNAGAAAAPVFSIAEKPIQAFASDLVKSEMLSGKLLFCCIDEYENLSELQQTVLNTYIKHSGPPLSYKVGMRRYGLKSRKTIDGADQLESPADYAEIDITEEGFEAFAERVVEHRLEKAMQDGVNVPRAIVDFLPDMSFEREALALGCDRIAKQVRENLTGCPAHVQAWLESTPPYKIYFLAYWSESSGQPLPLLVDDWIQSPETWDVRLRNYGYASLFWLSKGRKGARIRKYYAGSRTLLALAAGNIRYFLELIDNAINTQFDEGFGSPDEHFAIDPKAQTLAARAVGKRRLDQLEGLSEHGIELKRLVLAIGKVFFELARNPAGHAPEQNSFVLSGSAPAQAAVTSLLKEGVAHLAFEATPKTKATTQAELRDDEYRPHPIFCAFFEYSHRRKRRIVLSADSLLKLSSAPAIALSELLESREQTDAEQLPDQLAFFTDFFGRAD